MREEWIDRWKGLLITLVVIGHAVGGAEHLSGGQTRQFMAFVYKMIYMFHMPAFFCVVGVLWNHDSVMRRPFLTFLRKKAFRLLIPYFVFGLISVFMFYCGKNVIDIFRATASDQYYSSISYSGLLKGLGSLLHGGGWPDGEGFRCNSVLWFLPCMFVANLAHWIVDRYLHRSKWILLLVGLLLYYTVLLGRYRFSALPWGITLVPYYMLYIILGQYAIRPAVKRLQQLNLVGYAILLFVILLLGVAVTPDRYQAVRINVLWNIPFLLLAALGCFLSVCVAVSFTKSVVLAILGFYSLGIMLMHKPILISLQLLCNNAFNHAQGWRIAFAVLSLAVLPIITIAVTVIACKLIIAYTPLCLGERGRR